MYQQQHQQQFGPSIMPEQDMLYTILADLKRVTREYATAATESNCQTVRQVFTNLLHDTLNLQGELYHFMKQQNMYNASSQALRQDIDKQVRQYQQTQQKTQQFIQQKLGQTAVAHQQNYTNMNNAGYMQRQQNSPAYM